MAKTMFHVVMGLPGTGKTSAARFLAQKLPAGLIRLDDIYVTIFPRQEKLFSRAEGDRRLNAAYREMSTLIRNVGTRFPGEHFVVEAVLRSRVQRKLVMDSVYATGAPVSVLLLTAKREITRERIQRRHEAGISTCNVRMYERALAEFQEVRMPHRVIDNSGSVAELHRSLKLYIAEIGRARNQSIPKKKSLNADLQTQRL